MKLVLCRVLKDDDLWIISRDRSALGKLVLNLNWEMSEERNKEFLYIIQGVTDWPYVLMKDFRFLRVDMEGFPLYTGTLVKWSMKKENLL